MKLPRLRWLLCDLVLLTLCLLRLNNPPPPPEDSYVAEELRDEPAKQKMNVAINKAANAPQVKP